MVVLVKILLCLLFIGMFNFCYLSYVNNSGFKFVYYKFIFFDIKFDFKENLILKIVCLLFFLVKVINLYLEYFVFFI